MSIVPANRLVRVLSHDGELRRQRFTHESALHLVKRGIVQARAAWFHLKAGTRYSHLELCGNRRARGLIEDYRIFR